MADHEGSSANPAGGPFAVGGARGGAGGWPVGRFGTAALVLILLALAGPIVFVPGVLFPFVVPKAVWFRLLTAGLAGLMLHGVLTRRAVLDWRSDPVFVALAALLGASALAAAVGVAPVQSFFGDLGRMGGVWALLHVVVLYVVLRSMVPPGRWPVVWRAVGVVVVALAVSGLLDRYGLLVFDSPRARPGGFTGNPGYLGATMLLGVAVTGALAARARGVERWAWIGGVVLCLAVLFMSQTRAALLGLVVAGSVAAAAWVAFRGHGAPRWILAGAATGLVLTGLMMGLARMPAVGETARAVPGVSRLADTGPAGGASRIYLWRKAVEAYGARPLMGWGPEHEATAIGTRIDAEYYRFWPAGARADRSHNTYLGLLVTTGPLGMAAFVMFLAALAMTLRRGRRAGRLGDVETALLAGALAGYAFYLLFWFEDLGVWVVLTAIAARVGTAAAGRPLLALGAVRDRTSVPVLAAIWATLAALVVAQGVLPLRQAALLGRAEFAPDLAVDERLDLLESALRAPATQRLAAIIRHERYVQELFAGPDVRRDPVRLTRVLESAWIGLATARAELRREPFNDALHGRVASYAMLLYQVTRDDAYADEARAVLADAIAMAPARLRTRHLLSQVELVAGDPARAEQVLRDAMAVHDGFGETHHFLAVVALDDGRTDDALAWAANAALHGYAPARPDFHLRLGRALEAQGRHGDAARAYHLYLAAAYPAMDDDQAPGPGDLRDGDAEIVVRLPIARLRAGDIDGAIEAALLLGRFVPGLRGEIRRFLLDLTEGREGEWDAREVVIDPDRVRQSIG